ncbi:hypothetical protein [Hymenobacter arcticus]
MLPLAIQIPQPCAESWDAMTPTTAGRHCAACAKTVVDFTTYTDGELAAYVSQHSQLPCGRFRESQLGRVLRPAAMPVVGWRRWLGAVAALLGLGSLAAPARAQSGPAHPATTQVPAGTGQLLGRPALPPRPSTHHPVLPACPVTPPERILGGAPIATPMPPPPKSKK